MLETSIIRTYILLLFLPHIVKNHDKMYVITLTHIMDTTNVIGYSVRFVRQSGIVAHNVKLTGKQVVHQTIGSKLLQDDFGRGK